MTGHERNAESQNLIRMTESICLSGKRPRKSTKTTYRTAAKTMCYFQILPTRSGPSSVRSYRPPPLRQLRRQPRFSSTGFSSRATAATGFSSTMTSSPAMRTSLAMATSSFNSLLRFIPLLRFVPFRSVALRCVALRCCDSFH